MIKKSSDISSQSSEKNLSSKSPITMAELMVSFSPKKVSLDRGDEVTGKVLTIGKNEIVLDLGTKSEGVLDKKELSVERLSNLKIGDELSAFVVASENDNAQVILSLTQSKSSPKKVGDYSKHWQKFINAHSSGSKLGGKVVEVNKGGLLVEVEGTRGFLPASQLSFKSLSSLTKGGGIDQFIGQELSVRVIEVDPGSNRLIFSNRTSATAETREALAKFKAGQKVNGKVVAATPLGVYVELEGGLEGLVFSYEVSWEKTENIASTFESGQEIEAMVTGVDEEMGRVNLSLRQMKEDPFEKMSENYLPDDVVKGTVVDISQNGITVTLKDGVEGFLPTASLAGQIFEIGQTSSFIVDNVDKNRRKVNLAPFITSTEDLIYK